MKKYLIQLGIVSGIFVAIVVMLFGITYSILNTSSFKIDDSKNILILGDSHTECAIDDNIFARSANLSSSATAYPFSLIALKRIVADNPQIDTVLLSINTYTVSHYTDSIWLKGDVLYTKTRALISFAEMEDIRPFLSKPDFYIGLLKMPNLNLYKAIRHLNNPLNNAIDHNIGKYIKLDRNKLQTNIRLVGNKYPFMCTIDTLTDQYASLKKINTYCTDNNIKLILITTPFYDPDKYLQVEKFHILKDKFLSDVDYVDFSYFPLPDSCYGDMEHLNYHGAEIFSKHLQKNGINAQNFKKVSRK